MIGRRGKGRSGRGPILGLPEEPEEPTWVPGDAAGLTLHLDETSFAGTTWTNKVGSNHFVQGPDNIPPSLDAAGLNGLDAVLFENDTIVGEILTGAALSNYISASAYEYWIAFSISQAAASHADPWANVSLLADQAGNFGFAVRNNTVYEARGWHYGSGGTQEPTTRPLITLNTPSVAHVWLTGGALNCQINGGTIATKASSTTDVGSLGSVLRLARSYNNDFGTMKLGEIAMYNVALSAEDRASGETYFNDKWT